MFRIIQKSGVKSIKQVSFSMLFICPIAFTIIGIAEYVLKIEPSVLQEIY